MQVFFFFCDDSLHAIIVNVCDRDATSLHSSDKYRPFIRERIQAPLWGCSSKTNSYQPPVPVSPQGSKIFRKSLGIQTREMGEAP